MGQQCSSLSCKHVESDAAELSRDESPDPLMYDLMRKSIKATTASPNQTHLPTGGKETSVKSSSRRKHLGQQHLLYRNSHLHPKPISSNSCSSNSSSASSSLDGKGWLPNETPVECPTRLLIRKRPRATEEVTSQTNVATKTAEAVHIYAIRYPDSELPPHSVSEQARPPAPPARQEQCPPKQSSRSSSRQQQQQQQSPSSKNMITVSAGSKYVLPPMMDGMEVFSSAAMASIPRQPVMDWVTVSKEFDIFVADVGLTAGQCDHIIGVTEQTCRGQYAAYTYAKQTLGCREFPVLAQTSFLPVHTAVHAVIKKLGDRGSGVTTEETGKSTPQPKQVLQLDDREPHIVKYDVTRKERQKLDMHTDKSEWTFLIALSNGCGVDYDGGGTYFECLDATVHIQRGHALIFPGKLRHCGQKITSGLRFLLVGFLVDKANSVNSSGSNASGSNQNATATAIASIAAGSSE